MHKQQKRIINDFIRKYRALRATEINPWSEGWRSYTDRKGLVCRLWRELDDDTQYRVGLALIRRGLVK